MADKNNPQQGQFQLGIRPEVAQGVYSNLALISHSHSDFVIDFAQALPGMPKPDVCSRIILAPEHAKRLLAALQDNIYKSVPWLSARQWVHSKYFNNWFWSR